MTGTVSADRLGRLLPPLLLCALVALPGLSGCSSFSSSSPPLPDSTFSRLLMEMHLLSARASREGPLPAGIQDSILRRYGVQPETFDATLRYYSRRPAQFDALYDGVIDTLNAFEQRSRYRGGAPKNVRPQQ
ncbi:MAG: DUF4296 domain-containing protein [Salinibacter sp.]